MHTSSLAPQMETSLESKFSAAFEHIPSGGGSKNAMCNGSKPSKHPSTGLVTTATPSSEPSGEKTVSFRKGSDLESFESLSSLFANGLFTDLVICCHGKMFKCHRVVMAAASLYIRDALSTFYNNSPENTSGCNSCNTVMLLPTEIKMTDMEAILRFIYDGHVEVKVDSIESFLRSARLLNINGLSNVNIVFNNGTSANSEDSVNDNIELTATSTVKNNGYAKNTNSLLNGHAGMNSPPPSPPLLNSSLASLKAMTANQHSALTNGNHIGNKFLNGSLNNHILNHYKNNHKQRDQSPLRNESSLLGPNITPAHQSSTPKSIYNNGNMLLNNIRFNAANSTTGGASAGGGSVSRRKQKFPTNIPFIQEMLTPTAFLNSWMNINSEEDDEDDLDDNDDEKRLVIKDDSSNDCGSTIGDNVSTTSIDSKQPGPFSVVPSFPPQIPCMIEVEADPTTFPTYSDFNDSSQHSSQQKRRRNLNFKSLVFDGNRSEKKLKLPFPDALAAANANSNNSIDVSIKPTSPLMHNSNNQQTSPSEIVPKKQNNVRSSSLPAEKPLFSAYSTVKTAAGANPSASSPSSSSSASGSWVGSKWKCDICNKYYGNKQTLKEHMDYFHSNREEQIYICNICNKEYTWRKSLMKHYRDIHQMRNTPQLAEINRQLAALSSAKVRTGNASGSGTPGDLDSNSLQSFVSIANYSSRKTNTGSQKGSNSDNSEKSNKSESEMENDNTNDAVAEEEDYGNEDIGMNGSCNTDVDMQEEMGNSENNDIQSESATSTPEKIKSNETSRLLSEHSPASSMAST